MTVSADISSLTSSIEPYTARAMINDGVIDSGTSTVTGDRSSKLFSSTESELGKDDFLLLLVTQLRFQDPLNPMENTEFVSQLAQFRSMESNSNIESGIKDLNDSFKGTIDAQAYAAQSITNTSAVSLIGKEVRLRQTTVDWLAKAGNTATMQIHLGNAKNAKVEITDGDGNVVKTLQTEGKDSTNSTKLTWDGTTDTGGIASGGKYQIHITGEENDASLYAYVEDIATGVRFTSAGAMIKVAGQELSIGKILDVTTGAGGMDGSSLSSSTAVSLLGKYIRVKDDTLTYHQKDNEILLAKIDTGGNDQVQVDITDKSGNVVFSIHCNADDQGIATMIWNGETSNGGFAPAGEYSLHIKGQEDNPSIYSFTEGRVDGITDISGASRLRVNGQIVSIADVIDIRSISSLTDGTTT